MWNGNRKNYVEKLMSFLKFPKNKQTKKRVVLASWVKGTGGGGRKSCMRGRKLGRCQMSQQFAIHKIMEQCSCSDMKK